MNYWRKYICSIVNGITTIPVDLMILVLVYLASEQGKYSLQIMHSTHTFSHTPSTNLQPYGVNTNTFKTLRRKLVELVVLIDMAKFYCSSNIACIVVHSMRIYFHKVTNVSQVVLTM